jgi:PKD repeat protein
MKKTYLLLLLLSISITTLLSQNKSKVVVPVPTLNYSTAKTTACIDTIRYPQTKTTGVEADTIARYLREGAAQYYHFSGSGVIHGISAYMLLDFDGVPGNTDSIQLVAKVMKVNDYNEPIILIDSSFVTIYDVGYQEQALMFDAPISITDSFAIALEIPAGFTDTLFYTSNSSVSSDGSGEGLASIAYEGIWYNYYMRGWGWDVDILLSPIFEQEFTASYTVDTNSVCLGQPISFTNTTVSNPNTMFFAANPADQNILFGDMNSDVFDTTTVYTYTNAGAYNSIVESLNWGYSAICVADTSITVTVLDTAISNYNYASLGGGAYQFTDMSTNANTYYWDFGDGDTSTLQSPIHTYLTSNNYNVCLTVTDSNGCNVNTSCQIVSFVTGIASNINKEEVRIYPVPANKFLNVVIPSDYRNGSIVITDVVGKTVEDIEINNQESIKILTQEINSGVYFLSIENNGQKVYTKRILIDKK